MGSSTKSLKNKNLSAKPSNPLPTSEELNAYPIKKGAQKTLDKEEEIILKQVPKEEIRMNDEFDFINEDKNSVVLLDTLPDNTAQTPINIGFISFGAGGNRIAKSFIDL